jgi:cobalt-zinc-cadmium efflux system outer membrane protein
MRWHCPLVLALVVFTPPPPVRAADLTLAEALARTLRDGPALAAYSHELRALEADAWQAAAFANPIAELEVEDFAGSGDFHGMDEAQTTLSLAQLVELGGERAARIRLAEAASAVGRWDFEAARADALEQTARAFIDVLVAQERIALADEAIGQANELVRTASARVSAGGASPVEVSRAKVALHEAGLLRSTNGYALQAARLELAARLGADRPDFERALGALDPPPPLPSLDALTALVERNPEVGRWASELTARDAALASERAARVPDVELALGVRSFSGPNDTALVASVSLPLPLWDRNRYAIEAASARRERALELQRASRLGAVAEIARTHARLGAARESVETLRELLLPEADRAVATLRDGYRRGRFTSLEVLSAERARLEAHDRYVHWLGDARREAAALDRLVGALPASQAGER